MAFYSLGQIRCNMHKDQELEQDTKPVSHIFLSLLFQITAVSPPPPEESNCSLHMRKYPAQKKGRSKSHIQQRPPSARSLNDSQCSRNNPIEDDLLLKVGNRGRGKGEFTNPQGVAVLPNGERKNRVIIFSSLPRACPEQKSIE